MTPSSSRPAEQHDDHCWLTAMAHNWRITAVRGTLIRLQHGPCVAWLDVAAVRWPDYIAAARRALTERWG